MRYDVLLARQRSQSYMLMEGLSIMTFSSIYSVIISATKKYKSLNLHMVPLTCLFPCRNRVGHQVVNRSELVFPLFVTAHDLYLETGMHGILRVLDADEDARITPLGLPANIALQDEVFERSFVDDQVTT